MIEIFEVNGKKYCNRHNIAPVFVRAVTASDSEYSRGQSKWTASDMVAPPKMVILKRAHGHNVVRDVSDLIHTFRGNGLHRELERHANPNSITEERLEAEINGIKISTRPDHYDYDLFELCDYKSTSVYSFLLGAKEEWEAQLNIGAWFLRKYGFPVDTLKIHAILYDWNGNKAKRESDYMQTGFHTVNIPMWHNDEAEHYIRHAIQALEGTELAYQEGGRLVDCTNKQRWLRDEKWAVMKKGRKSALRVFDTYKEACVYLEILDKKHSIQYRPGTYGRCGTWTEAGDLRIIESGYCEAAPWCEQLKKERENEK